MLSTGKLLLLLLIAGKFYASSAEYKKITLITADYRKFNAASADYRKIAATSIECRKLILLTTTKLQLVPILPTSGNVR